ncbi:MAG: leucine-rich repeat protein [Butyrivibrio sp.]|nr:leucine-rich repeat protein [Butyrivibrio sp.]
MKHIHHTWRVLAAALILSLTTTLCLPGGMASARTQFSSVTVGVQARTKLKGSTNEEKIFNFLRDKLDFNNAAACGVLANISQESSFRPDALGDNGTSFGICQWHNTRWSKLESWCDANDYDSETLEGQLYFMKYELENTYRTTLNKMQNASNSKAGAYQAAYDWCVTFEIPANKESKGKARGKLAKKTYWPKYKKYKSGSSSSSDDDLTKGATYQVDEGLYRYLGSKKVALAGITGNASGSSSQTTDNTSGDGYTIIDGILVVNAPRAASYGGFDLAIPQTVLIYGTECKVTAIDASALEDESSLVSVTIPKTVTSIGKRAFAGCSSLDEVTFLCTSAPSIGKKAFSGVDSDILFRVTSSAQQSLKKALQSVAPKGATYLVID